jgi:hypothetical protein
VLLLLSLLLLLLLQTSHQQELARYGHAKTTAELQAMLGALQKEVDTHAGHARKAAVSAVGQELSGQQAPRQCLWPCFVVWFVWCWQRQNEQVASHAVITISIWCCYRIQ